MVASTRGQKGTGMHRELFERDDDGQKSPRPLAEQLAAAVVDHLAAVRT